MTGAALGIENSSEELEGNTHLGEAVLGFGKLSESRLLLAQDQIGQLLQRLRLPGKLLGDYQVGLLRDGSTKRHRLDLRADLRATNFRSLREESEIPVSNN